MLALWLWFVLWVTTAHGEPAVDWDPKQQKNEEKIFLFRGFLAIVEGTAKTEKKYNQWKLKGVSEKCKTLR